MRPPPPQCRWKPHDESEAKEEKKNLKEKINYIQTNHNTVKLKPTITLNAMNYAFQLKSTDNCTE